MAKSQTRKSISLRGTTYRHVREVCADREVSMSDYLETLIAADMQALGRPVPVAPRRALPPISRPVLLHTTTPNPPGLVVTRRAPDTVVIRDGAPGRFAGAPPTAPASARPVSGVVHRGKAVQF